MPEALGVERKNHVEQCLPSSPTRHLLNWRHHPHAQRPLMHQAQCWALWGFCLRFTLVQQVNIIKQVLQVRKRGSQEVTSQGTQPSWTMIQSHVCGRWKPISCPLSVTRKSAASHTSQGGPRYQGGPCHGCQLGVVITGSHPRQAWPGKTCPLTITPGPQKAYSPFIRTLIYFHRFT